MYAQASERVRITLEAPYAKAKDGSEISVTLRLGYGDATPVGHNSGAAIEGLSARSGLDADEFVDAGGFMDSASRSIATYIPGKAYDVNLFFGDEERNSADVDRSIARMYFGNERIRKQATPGTAVHYTFNYERERVARLWGGWLLPKYSLAGKAYCDKGMNNFDGTKIGAPRIPRVRIERITQNGKVTGEAFRPWDYFSWESDVDGNHPELTLTSPQAQPNLNALAGFTLADLEAFVASRRAQEAEQSKKGVMKHA